MQPIQAELALLTLFTLPSYPPLCTLFTGLRGRGATKTSMSVCAAPRAATPTRRVPTRAAATPAAASRAGTAMASAALRAQLLTGTWSSATPQRALAGWPARRVATCPIPRPHQGLPMTQLGPWSGSQTATARWVQSCSAVRYGLRVPCCMCRGSPVRRAGCSSWGLGLAAMAIAGLCVCRHSCTRAGRARLTGLGLA